MLFCPIQIRPVRGLSRSASNAITTAITIGVITRENQSLRFRLNPVTKLWKIATMKMMSQTVLGTRFSNAASRFSETSISSFRAVSTSRQPPSGFAA